jgi:hypothetical protein
MTDEGDRRADEPADDEGEGSREEQAEHQRELAERDPLRLAPDLDVHDKALGGGEGGRHRPPRQRGRREERCLPEERGAGHRGERQEGRRDDDDERRLPWDAGASPER